MTQASHKKGREKKTKKDLGRIVLYVLMIMLWVFASLEVSERIVYYLIIWTVSEGDLGKPVVTAVYSALAYTLAMIMIILLPLLVRRKMDPHHNDVNWVKQERKKELKTLGLFDWPTWTDIGLAPVGFIVYSILAGGLMALFSLFPWFNASEIQDVGFNYFVSGGDRVLAFLTTVIVAPIAEEVIFRGWLYGRMREKIASRYSNVVSMIVSIFLVSLLFGIIHGQWNVGVNVFALSIVLCGLREITGTIHAGILLHMLKNGVAFWLLFMM